MQSRPWKRLAGVFFLFVAALCAHLLLWSRFRHARSPGPAQDASIATIAVGEWITLGGILIVAAVLALRPGGGLIYDELYTYTHFVGRVAPWGAAPLLGVGVFNNHVAYSWLAGIAAALLGARDVVLRLPAAVLATLAVFAVWRFTRAFATRPAALVAAGLLAVSPMHITWAHSARGYSGLALMAVVSSGAFFRLLERPSLAAAVVHALSTAAAIYFHLYGIWLAAIQYGLYGWLAIRSRAGGTAFVRLWQSFLAAGVLVAALYGPVILVLLDIMGGTQARARTAIQPNFPIALFDAIAGTSSGLARGAAGALLLIGLFRLRGQPLRATYVALLLCVPLGVAWLIVRPQDLYPRFFHFWTPMACVLMAVAVAGSTRATWNARRVLAAAGAAGLLVPVVAGWIPVKNESAVDNGYRAALLTAREEIRGTRSILIGPDATLLRYYLGAAPPVIESADDIDQMMRDDQSPMIVLSHAPGWSGPEHLRMASLLERRCRAATVGFVVTYRCL